MTVTLLCCNRVHGRRPMMGQERSFWIPALSLLRGPWVIPTIYNGHHESCA